MYTIWHFKLGFYTKHRINLKLHLIKFITLVCVTGCVLCSPEKKKKGEQWEEVLNIF